MNESGVRGESLNNQPVWIEESFYFGNANWPSDATYRTSGERLQLQVEKSIDLTRQDNGQFKASTDELAEFLAAYEDCSFTIADSHEVNPSYGGGRTEPKLWVVGWIELTTDEQKSQYHEDATAGSKILQQ